MKEQQVLQQESGQEGFVVWDQRGLVVRWSDGSSRRFSWDALRHSNGCPECQHQPLAAQSMPTREFVAGTSA